MARLPLKGIRDLLDDVREYASGRSDYRVETAAGPNDPFLYPIDLTRLLLRPEKHFAPLDQEGIPRITLRGMGTFYLPSRVGCFALAHYNHYRTHGDERSRDNFIKAAGWYLRQTDGLYWYHYRIGDWTRPWLSCMAQGQALSVLARAHAITSDTVYLEQARRSAAPLLRSSEEGGVLAPLPSGELFLQEYPGRVHANVLNGAMYALVGLHDYLLGAADTDSNLSRLFETQIAGLRNNLARWDVNGWTRYDYPSPESRPNFVTPTYQVVHVALLRYLSVVTGVPEFESYHRRWSEKLASMSVRFRALSGKVAYRLQCGW